MAGSSKIWAGLSSVTELAKKSNIPAIVNNLSSTSTTSALSAYQGKVLNDKMSQVGSVSWSTLASGSYNLQNTGGTVKSKQIGTISGNVSSTIIIRVIVNISAYLSGSMWISIGGAISNPNGSQYAIVISSGTGIDAYAHIYEYRNGIYTFSFSDYTKIRLSVGEAIYLNVGSNVTSVSGTFTFTGLIV